MNLRAMRQTGFTLVEAAMSVAIVSTVFAVAMSTVGASRTAMATMATRATANALAQQLLAECIEQPYWSPIYHSGFGPSADEAATGNRSLFDDVDDYHGWSASPPQLKDGTVLTQYAGWTRTVRTPWVNPANPTQEVNYESGVKCIIVEVKRGNVVLASRYALKTVAWIDQLGPQ